MIELNKPRNLYLLKGGCVLNLFILFFWLMIEEKKEDKKPVPDINLVSFAFDLGFTIAIPLVVFALLGRWVD